MEAPGPERKRAAGVPGAELRRAARFPARGIGLGPGEAAFRASIKPASLSRRSGGCLGFKAAEAFGVGPGLAIAFGADGGRIVFGTVVDGDRGRRSIEFGDGYVDGALRRRAVLTSIYFYWLFRTW